MAMELEILLVEDTPADAELTLRALRRKNMANNVTVARDGAEAMEIIFSNGFRPRLILLDLKLPKISGMEVLARLKGDERTKKIPVVIMTSSREDRDLEEAYRLGVNSYVVKPVEFQAFMDVVVDLGLYWMLVNVTPGEG